MAENEIDPSGMPDSEGVPAGEPQRAVDRGITLRAIAFGLCISFAVNLLGNTVRYILHASFMAYSHMPMGNLVLYLLSILICTPLAVWFGRRLAFSPSEWITVFCMGFISSLGPTYGISGYLVGFMVGPYYFATPENEWSKYLHPHLPDWLIPSNSGNISIRLRLRCASFFIGSSVSAPARPPKTMPVPSGDGRK